jgi:geranyl-CoA carboxylase alpha subunit
MNAFTSILVANRGEIAVRVIRGVQALGYRAIAVYSAADEHALHVRLADDAALIGPAPVGESYLSIDNILAAAKITAAQAIHPGYGFLSENAEFAQACEKAGLVFIGPTADSINLMGNKAAAKKRMIAANVPCVPGYEEADQSDEVLVLAGSDIGFPLMVKAAAGGGGRGMRLVEEPASLMAALHAARTEALNGFGSDELILEKAILRPRHVEIQVLADNHGNVIHLGERDCSVQRRHQKVVEEAPSPVVSAQLREAMGTAAVEAARAINYRGAGTVEFLLDEQQHFYFLEMNTRLQVEHPVTEMVTGLDLVALQVDIAQGRPLEIGQHQVDLRGHAMEVRLYAEDTANDFLPRSGHIALWQAAEGSGVRIDAGIATGQEVSPYYDPMLAKLIAWGENREIARQRLINALKNTLVFGTITNRRFLIDTLQHETFATGRATTAFIGDEFTEADLAVLVLPLPALAMAAVLQYCLERSVMLSRSLGVSEELLDWSSAGGLLTRYAYEIDGNLLELTVSPRRSGGYQVRVDEELFDVEVLSISGNDARLQCNGKRQQFYYFSPQVGELHISLEGQNFELRNLLAFAAQLQQEAGGGRVLAPKHGAVQAVLVAVGDKVKKGQPLLIVEAMKMQHEIVAELDGVVVTVDVEKDNQVEAEELLVEIEARE